MKLNDAGIIAQEEWLKTKQVRNNIELDSFIIMPNHLHGIIIIVGATRCVAPKGITQKANSSSIITPADKDAIQKQNIQSEFRLKPDSLGSIIGQFKSMVTKRIRNKNLISFQWQRNYYEHIIRDERDLYNIRKYIDLNPLKWEMDEYY